jgi:hypothetical protein
MIGFILHNLQSLSQNTPGRLRWDYRFWILLALAGYYSSSAILFSFTYLENQQMLISILYLHAIANIMHNVLLTIGVFHIGSYR